MLEDKLNFSFEHSFVDNLGGLYEKCRPESVSSPSMLFFNYQLAEELNLDPLQLNSDEGLQIFSGNKVPKGSIQIAQAYAVINLVITTLIWEMEELSFLVK